MSLLSLSLSCLGGIFIFASPPSLLGFDASLEPTARCVGGVIASERDINCGTKLCTFLDGRMDSVVEECIKLR